MAEKSNTQVLNYFEELNRINCADKVEKKNGLTYLSWSYAWGELKKRYPLSYYTVYENEQGFNYFTDGHTCWVKTGVTVVLPTASLTKEELEHIEYLPVMDFKNKSIPLENVTSFDVNKTIQRSLTKAVARHGLGLYIYAGEDLPEGCEEKKAEPKKEQAKKEPTWRDKVSALAKELGLDLKALAQDYELTRTTPEEKFEKVYKELLSMKESK